MKTIKTHKSNLVIKCYMMLMIIVTMSCGSDDADIDNCANNAWVDIFSNEAQAYSNALLAYQDNPTAGNCNNVKSAAVNYLEALRDALDCVPTANRAEVNEAINEAQDEVNSEDCD